MKSISKKFIVIILILITINIICIVRSNQLNKIYSAFGNTIQDENYWLHRRNINIEEFTEVTLIEGKVISYDIFEDYWEILINPMQPNGEIADFSISQKLPKNINPDNIYRLTDNGILDIDSPELFESLEGNYIVIEVNNSDSKSFISEVKVKQL